MSVLLCFFQTENLFYFRKVMMLGDVTTPGAGNAAGQLLPSPGVPTSPSRESQPF